MKKTLLLIAMSMLSAQTVFAKTWMLNCSSENYQVTFEHADIEEPFVVTKNGRLIEGYQVCSTYHPQSVTRSCEIHIGETASLKVWLSSKTNDNRNLVMAVMPTSFGGGYHTLEREYLNCN